MGLSLGLVTGLACGLFPPSAVFANDPENSAAEELLPKDEAMSLALERRRNALETQLHNAVAEERYEDAARLRDELKALGGKAS